MAREPFFVSNLFLYVLSSRERTKAPGTRKNQSQQPSAHESQATSFVRLLFGANSFSFNHRGQKNSLFTQHQQQDEHRSNSICPFPLLERLFAVILSVPVLFFELPSRTAFVMTSNGNPTLAYLLSDTREIMHHCNFSAGWPLNAEIARGCLSVVEKRIAEHHL